MPLNIDYLGMLAGGLDRKRWLLQHEESSAEEAGRLFSGCQLASRHGCMAGTGIGVGLGRIYPDFNYSPKASALD
ncbi:hypothetical protein [Corynebacterium propinquum]